MNINAFSPACLRPRRHHPSRRAHGIAAVIPALLLAGAGPAAAAVAGVGGKIIGPDFSPAPVPAAAEALVTGYARAGWQAVLSTRAHGVRGTVTIVDADTFRVDDFFYDGGGINVHFILAASDNNTEFRENRLVTDLNLLGTPYSGGSLSIDLPFGTSFDSYNAVSLWCLPASANFGSGTFIAPIPEPAGTSLLAAAGVGLLLRRQRGKSSR